MFGEVRALLYIWFMNYASVCSGVEAFGPAWHKLGYEPVFHAEIEPHASAVLRYHYPTVPNIGDFSRFKFNRRQRKHVREKYGHEAKIDLLCGGTPCQSFSVAGLREGLKSEKGNLSLEFVKLAKRMRPKFILWENVPGVLSSGGGKDFACFLEALATIGYVPDVEQLDLQYFGVPQRRKRIFVVCVRIEDLLRTKTTTSLRMAAELLLQCWQSTWAALSQVLSPDSWRLGCTPQIAQSVAFLQARMSLLEAALGKSAVTKLLNNLDVRTLRFTAAQQPSASAFAMFSALQPAELRTDTGGLIPYWTEGACGSKSIAALWSSILADLYSLPNTSTTSILTKQTIASKIFAFATATANIVGCITNSDTPLPTKSWSADYWNLANLCSTTLQSSTNYAKQASRGGIGQYASSDDWRNHINAASHLVGIIKRNIGDRSLGREILFESESLLGYPKKGGKTGKDVTGTLSSRPNGGDGLGTDFDLAGGLQIANTLKANSGRNQTEETYISTVYDTNQITSKTNRSNPKPGVCHTLPASADAPLLAPAIAFTTEQTPKFSQELALTLTQGSPTGGGQPQCVLPGKSSSVTAFGGGNTTGEIKVATCLTHHGGRLDFDSETFLVEPSRPQPFKETADCFYAAYGTKWNGNAAATNGSLFVNHPMPITACFKQGAGAQAGSIGYAENLAPTLTAGNSGTQQSPALLHQSSVRRLTPLECERLMGWADEHTKYGINAKGKQYELADGPRYRICGNGWGQPVVTWIAERMKRIDAMLHDAG